MRAFIAATIVIASLAAGAAQSLSREAISSAIEQGRAGKVLQKKCGAKGENGIDVVVEGPVGRVMRAARDARREHRQFGIDDVTGPMKAPYLTVIARRDSMTTRVTVPTPGIPSSMAPPEPPAILRRNSTYRTTVVLRSTSSDAAEPAILEPVIPIAGLLDDGRGGRTAFGVFAITATFDLAGFNAMPHRDIDVVLYIGDTGEQHCTISDKDRQTIR